MGITSIISGSADAKSHELYVSNGNFCVSGKEISREMGYSKGKKFKDITALLNAGVLEEFLNVGEMLLKESESAIDNGKIQFHSPIDKTAKILCAGFNYYKHNVENNLSIPSIPYFFQRAFTTVVGPYDTILKPKMTKKMDYEIELAVMIGKRGKYISKSDAMEYVAGYFIVNDVSFRDYQFNEYNSDIMKMFGQNWLYGKNMDRSFPSGPFLVPRIKCEKEHFELETKINGERTQNASTSEMIYEIPELVHFASQGITLLPGDIISTGTPEGTARGGGHAYLSEGDIIEGTIYGIGTIRNEVVGETEINFL